LFADRLRALPVILWASLAYLVILYLLCNHASATVLLVCVAAFGFLWLFILPFQVPIVIAADPTRRAAVLIAGAQLLGSSIGPLLASAVVSDRDVRGTLGLGAACIVVSLALITLVVWRVRPPSANAAEFA
jgi:predicted MFS family arabinose efflux permease